MTTAHDYYFKALDAHRFTPTPHVGGGWNPAEQHIGPVVGLITHLIDRDRRVRGRDQLVIGRLSLDILGVLLMDAFEVRVNVIRPGRTIELVEARLHQSGRDAVLARCWLMHGYDTARLAGTPYPPMPAPETFPESRLGDLWPGGFVRSLELRQETASAGQARSWVRPRMALLKDEDVDPVARMLGVIDVANGLCPRVLPDQATYPNLDLTAHLFRPPTGDWVGLETGVSFGTQGVGVTHSLIHDVTGPLGLVSQTLTVRPAG